MKLDRTRCEDPEEKLRTLERPLVRANGDRKSIRGLGDDQIGCVCDECVFTDFGEEIGGGACRREAPDNDRRIDDGFIRSRHRRDAGG